MCLTIHAVHFYNRRLVCSRRKTIKGLVVGYLDVHGRVLLENRVEIVYELRAQFDSDRWQSGVTVLLLQGLLELVLCYG